MVKAWHRSAEGPGSRQQSGANRPCRSRASNDLAVGNRLFLERAGAHLKTVYRSGDGQPTITPVKADHQGARDRWRPLQGVDQHQADRQLRHVRRVPPRVPARRTFPRDARKPLSVVSRRPARRQAAKGLLRLLAGRADQWKGKLPEGAEVSEDSHVIVWPDFGKVILGEMLISDFSRRLTMVRLELGSPIEGAWPSRTSSRAARASRDPAASAAACPSSSCSPRDRASRRRSEPPPHTTDRQPISSAAICSGRNDSFKRADSEWQRCGEVAVVLAVPPAERRSPHRPGESRRRDGELARLAGAADDDAAAARSAPAEDSRPRRAESRPIRRSDGRIARGAREATRRRRCRASRSKSTCSADCC